MAYSELVESLKGKLIVSVQAYPGEPMRHPETMAQIARACELGGAAAIRCQGLSDISAIKGRVEIPVIGLWKEGHEQTTFAGVHAEVRRPDVHLHDRAHDRQERVLPARLG